MPRAYQTVVTDFAGSTSGSAAATLIFAVSNALGTLLRGFSTYVQQRVEGWRTGSRGSQAFLLVVLLGLVAVAVGVAARWPTRCVPTSLWFLFLMLGMMLLRFVPLLLLGLVLVGVAVWTSVESSFAPQQRRARAGDLRASECCSRSTSPAGSAPACRWRSARPCSASCATGSSARASYRRCPTGGARSRRRSPPTVRATPVTSWSPTCARAAGWRWRSSTCAARAPRSARRRCSSPAPWAA